MPRRELKFPDWLREARRIVAEQGASALRDNIGENLDDEQVKDTLVRLFGEAGRDLDEDIQTQAEGLDKIVELVVYIDSREAVLEDPVNQGRFELVRWCHDCRQGRHSPEVCISAGLERRFGPFRDAVAARSWVNRAAISKRAPFVFELEDLETGARVRLTGFSDSDWD